ncbi:MAG: DUF1893 domain-containing protein [Clostridia bacterium]|nr:DUF1893 domain-containing protein [Clostridia bacterium]
MEDLKQIIEINNDLIKAKENLNNHTIALVKNNVIIVSEKKGISPMMDYIKDGVDLNGFSVADVIVGKAVALLFVKEGIKNVFAKVISKAGLEVLKEYKIYTEYETLTDNIINRKGTDICPMEKTVLEISDPSYAYEKLKETLSLLKNNNG